jgi:transposase
MANNPIKMAKVRQILRLYSEGKSKLQISEHTGSSRNTIKKYIRIYESLDLQYSEVEKLSNGKLTELFCIDERAPNDRTQALLSLLPQIEKELKRKGMTKSKQWKIYIQSHPDGFKFTRFCCILNRYLMRAKPVMHIDHKAGDKMFIDFAGKKLYYYDRQTGAKIETEVFASILGCSQLIYVEAIASQKTEHLISACENSLHFYGGSPSAVVPDNLKAAVIKSSRYEPQLNELFEDFASHYSMSVLPARSYRPRDKALVEGAVKIIYNNIYSDVEQCEYYSLEELNEAIGIQLKKLNNQLLTNRTYSRTQQFEEVEKPTLRPLPAFRYQLKHQYCCKVQKNGHVHLKPDQHYYSVPFTLIGKSVKILYTDLQVEIYHQYDCVAEHQRNIRPHQYTTNTDHLASTHKFVSEWSEQKFMADAQKIHSDVAQYISMVLKTKPHPEAAYKACLGILNLGRKLGNGRLINACRRAEKFGLYGFYHIESILQKGLDTISEDENSPDVIVMHHNIRGSNYYQ